MIVRGRPCKDKASANDPYYKYIAEKRAHILWKMYGDYKEENKDFYTEDLKSLLNCMLSFEPEERLTMSQVREHPWTTGETATLEEVVNYMREMQTAREKA